MLPTLIRYLVAGSMLLTCAAMAQSQSAEYPVRPIRVLIGFPPGGSSDVVARLLAQRLTEHMKVPVIVDNKAGAGGSIAAAEAARSVPDGYTLLYATSSITLTPSLQKSSPFDPVRDFSPIALVASAPLVMVVHPSFEATDVQGFIRYALAHPKMPYATTGVGINSHLAGAQFDKAFRLGMTPVAYRGGAPALADVSAGHIPMMFNVLTDTLQQIQGQRVRALAVLASKRAPLLPGIPTIAEATGHSGLEVGAWHGLVGPKGLPQAIVARLEREVNIITASPEFKERLSSLGSDSLGGTSAEFGAYLKSEHSKWGKLIKELDLTE